MKFAEFRVYVQVEETPDGTVERMRDFIRACIGNLDGVSAVEVEPPRGSVRDAAEREMLMNGKSTQLM